MNDEGDMFERCPGGLSVARACPDGLGPPGCGHGVGASLEDESLMLSCVCCLVLFDYMEVWYERVSEGVRYEKVRRDVWLQAA